MVIQPGLIQGFRGPYDKSLHNIYYRTLSDKEAAQEESAENVEIVGIISKPIWQIIIKYKLRGFVLAMAKELDVSSPEQFNELMAIVKEFDTR